MHLPLKTNIINTRMLTIEETKHDT